MKNYVKHALLMTSSMLAISHADASHGITDGTQLKASPVHQALSLGAEQTALPFGLSDVQIDNIATSLGWRRLLLFKDSPSGRRDQSSLDNPQFFIAPNGHDDARAELIATLAAMANKDTATLCRFVARMHFLNTELDKLGIRSGVDDSSCTDFHAWADQMDANKLSLVFAEEHANNLASAFAHVLIRADKASGAPEDAVAINYTVIGEPNDGTLASTIKSVAGRYPGVMEILPFSDKLNDYLAKDERDLWQYELDLTPGEVQQIMRHIWETKDMARPYFFSHDNCATEIVRLIDVVRPTANLRRAAGRIVIPSQIAVVLADAGLIKKTTYLPSASTERQFKLNQAAYHERTGAAADITMLLPNNNPVQASAVHRIGLSAGSDSQRGTTLGIGINAAYQDLLDNPTGVRKFHDVQLLSIYGTQDDEKFKISEATLFSHRSLNPINTAKNGITALESTQAIKDGAKPKRANAWAMRLGAKQVIDASNPANDDHLVLDVGYQKGLAWSVGLTPHIGNQVSAEISDTVCYVLAGGVVQAGRINQGYRVGIEPVAGCVSHFNERLRGMMELSTPYFYHPDSAPHSQSGYWQPSISAGVQYDLSQNYAVRVNAKAERVNDDTHSQAGVTLLHYF